MKMFKRIIAVTAALAMLVCCTLGMTASATQLVVPVSGSDIDPTIQPPVIEAGSAIVMNANTGAVIFEHNAYQQRPMASTTKIMTALLAFEAGDIGREITINAEMLSYDERGSTKLGLVQGDKITMNDLIVAMMLLSGNDCAQSIAVALGGSFDGFASMMNERASELGMLNTHFITPSGLDDPQHYSTAYDMAVLGAYAMKNEDFATLVGKTRETIRYGNPVSPKVLANHNYLLEGQRQGVKGCNGIKTGHTDDAGYCLVSHVERDGVSLVCVTLGTNYYWDYHSGLYDYAFAQYRTVTATPDMPSDEMLVVGGAKQTVNMQCLCDGEFRVLGNQVNNLTSQLNLNRFEYAPISENQVLGSLTYYYGNMPVADFPIIAKENIECVTNDWVSAYIDAVKYNMQNQN
ncbi:MAG: D-alanyl-D-alanine carboxypeptidase [Ruminococcaceae bacterium]|nr:D-alanyl-D-alanine carboxypeptidase [Oscillospiraceae bacterium]